ncbi:MAG: CDP-glucose 4,6-dehydratase [Crocinitomicaceae bacterium]|nr:CDP-glucose 4,6-dehydratase [Crocinitomicaceae bacterium]
MNFNELKSTYEGKRVLLTGHTGFKGTWMTLMLKLLGAEVKGYALPPIEHNALYHEVRAELYCDSVIADVRNRDKVEREITKFNPDFIFHMAAQALVLESYKNPVETYQTNVMGTLHVLDSLKSLDYPCKTIVITTDKVYENFEREEPYEESERMGGFDPYSNSKACCELLTSSYRSSFFNPDKYNLHRQSIATVRSGNVIGGGDWSGNRIIPDLVRSLFNNEMLIVRNPKAVRPWQHVLEPLHGYLTLGAHMDKDPIKYATAYNFGPNVEDQLNVEELIKEAIRIWGSGNYKVSHNQNQPHEANLLRLDIEKAKKELNWTPQFDSKKAISYTLEWYKAVHDEKDIKEFTFDQIKTYYGINE